MRQTVPIIQPEVRCLSLRHPIPIRFYFDIWKPGVGRDGLLLTSTERHKEEPVINWLGFKKKLIECLLLLALIQNAASPTNWTRSSTASAFIEPAVRTRNNLHVITRSLVTKVLLANTTNGLTATGVQFTKNNNNYTVSARREVILSAGIFTQNNEK